MKKSILICVAFAGSILAGRAVAGVTDVPTHPEAKAVCVEAAPKISENYVDKGTLARVSVDRNQPLWTLKVPSPAEPVIGIMPNPVSWTNYGELVITMRAFMLDLEPGQSCPVDVAVQLPGNQTGIYHIIVTAY